MNLEIVKTYQRVLDKTCTSQLALAWVLAREMTSCPDTRNKRRKYLEENAGAVQIALTPEDPETIDELTQGRGSRRPLSGINDWQRKSLNLRCQSIREVFVCDQVTNSDCEMFALFILSCLVYSIDGAFCLPASDLPEPGRICTKTIQVGCGQAHFRLFRGSGHRQNAWPSFAP